MVPSQLEVPAIRFCGQNRLVGPNGEFAFFAFASEAFGPVPQWASAVSVLGRDPSDLRGFSDLA